MFRTNRKLFYGIISCSAFLILFSVVQILLMNVAVPDITNIIISFSIPLTLLCGFALHYFLQANKYAGRLRIISLSGLTGLILLGAYGSIGAVNPVTTLFNKEDQEAITWINQNTSVNDKFLINSFIGESGMCLPMEVAGSTLSLGEILCLLHLSKNFRIFRGSLISIMLVMSTWGEATANYKRQCLKKTIFV